MAKKSISKKKGKGKPKKPDPRKAPYDPLRSPYETQGDFDDAVEAAAQGQYQPLYNDWEGRRGTSTRQHTGRVSDIHGMYNTGSEARKAALAQTSTALNNLITLNSGLSGATRDAMSAALRGAQGSADTAARELGVAGTQIDPGVLSGLGSAVDVSNIGTTGEFASILGGLGRDIGINEVGRQGAVRQEGNRWQGVLDELTKEKTRIEAQLPGFRETARQNLTTTELGRNAQSTQQGLAERQFGEQKTQNRFQRSLSRRQQREQERSNKAGEGIQKDAQAETNRSNQANESIQWAQVRETQRQNDAAIAASGDENERALLEAKGKRFSEGVKIIDDFFKPTKLETGKKKIRKSYSQRVTHGYDALVSQVSSATGAGYIETRQMILAAVNPSTPWGARWVARANREIQRMREGRKAQRQQPAIDKRGNPGG